jgi:hypothetical protein
MEKIVALSLQAVQLSIELYRKEQRQSHSHVPAP